MKNLYIFLFLFLPLLSFGQSFRTASFTGSVTDFNLEETYNSPGIPSIVYGVAYDQTHIYFSVVNTSGNFNGNDSFNLFIDTDPDGDINGSNTGSSFANVTPSLPFNANYGIRVEENYSELRGWTGTDWSNYTSPVTTNVVTNSNHRQFAIAKADLGNPAMIRFTMWMGFNGGIFAAVPADLGSSTTPVFSEYFGSVDINRAGSNPSKVVNTNATYASFSGGSIPSGTYSRLEITGFPQAAGDITIAPGGTLAITGVSITNLLTHNLVFNDWAGMTVDVGAPTTINGTGQISFTSGGISRTNNSTAGVSVTINPEIVVTGDFYANSPLIRNEITLSGNAINRLPLRFFQGSVLRYNSNLMTTTGPEWGSGSIVSLAGVPDNVIVDQPMLALDGNKILNGVLTVESGNLDLNSYDLTLISSTSRSAVIGPIAAGASIIGNTVVANKYIPARGDGNAAFRFLASPVDGPSIFESIQSNGSSFISRGTQVTGGAAALGFDQSLTNNPSMFQYLNNPMTGSPRWEAVANTDATPFNVGIPYRTFIRGDRSISLTQPNQTANNTTLSATGSLGQGNITYDSSSAVNRLSDDPIAFNMIANPYMAYVDMSQVLAQSTDVNANFYYVWDPTVNMRGGYVTVTLSTSSPTMNGVNNVAGSDADQFMEPWQSCFVQNNATIAAGASVLFSENTKTTEISATSVFSTPQNLNRLQLTLKDGTGNVVDGTFIDFDNTFSSNIDGMDAEKIPNLDESLAFTSGNNNYSILRNALPSSNLQLPVHLTDYRQTSYNFDFSVDGLAGYDIILFDTYLNTQHAASTGSYSFTVDTNVAASTRSDRFMILFDNVTLSHGDSAFAKAISLYPNPVTNGKLYIQNNTGSSLSYYIFNMLGQSVATYPVTNENMINVSTLSKGTYIIEITDGVEKSAQKLIIE